MRPPSEQALRFGTEAHYLDASLYDRQYARRRYDVRFYEEIAREHGGPVLELGAGSGRVTIALARAGHEVVAVDRMATMLARMRELLARESAEVRARVRIVRGDLRTVRVGRTERERRRFALVISPFNVLMHLYARKDFERALATARAHLAGGGAGSRRRGSGGRLVFDVLMPDLRALARDPTRTYVSRPLVDASGRKWHYREQFQYEPRTQVQMITTILVADDDPDEIRVLPLAHRQFFPQELEALLDHGGFEIESQWGDFERGPIREGCESQVIVARARRQRERR